MKSLLFLLAVVAAGSEFTEYKSWKPTTPEAYILPPIVECAPASAGPGPGPHAKHFIRVYVSPNAQDVFQSDKKFPVGTVIVKEKLLNKTDEKPKELGIMIKRESGWEYQFVTDGKRLTGKDVQNCATCHRTATHDSVFGSVKAK